MARKYAWTYLSLEVICSERGKLSFEEQQVMFKDKYPNLFLSQIEDIVYYIITKPKRAVIGQSAMGYCAGKPTEKSRVF